MSTYRLSLDDNDDFELTPLPPFIDYDEFMAQWEEEGRQTKQVVLNV